MSTTRLAFHPRPGEDWRFQAVETVTGKDRTILVIPGEHALVRWIDVQGKTPQQIRAAALAQLAPELAEPQTNCIAALGETRDGKRQIAIMSRTTAEAFLKAAGERNIKPSAIVPDICLVSPPTESDAVIVHTGSGEALARQADAAFAIQSDLLDLVLPGATRTEATLETEAARTLRTNADRLPDFLAALPTRPSTNVDQKHPARIVWAMAAAIVLAIAAPWANAIRLDMSARAMEREAEQIAAQALPAASQIRNARAQLGAALLAHTNGRQRIETAAILLGELTALPDIAIARLDASADSPLITANLTAPNADSATPLRERLAARNYTAEHTASDAPDGRAAIDLTVRPNP